MLNLVKYNNNSRKIVTNGYSLLMVSHVNELKNEQLEYLDGIIIDTNEEIHAKEILSLKEELYKIISKHTGQKYDKVYADSDRDYWMKADKALEYGMIDEILTKS